ncbi:MAG: ferritin-like domain-containing protein [Endomicrobiales bacterium]
MGKTGKAIVGLDVQELLADLNRAYCDEWLAYYSYVYMQQVVSGPAYEDMREFLEKISVQEREHIEELAARISELGGKPNIDPMKLVENANYPYPKPPDDTGNYDQITDAVVNAEGGAIDVYNKLARKTQGKDDVTYALVTHILAEEVQHEEMFENLNLGSRRKVLEPAGAK